MWAISEVISVFGNCSLKIIVIIVSYRLNVRFPSNTSLLGSDECAEEKMGDDFYCTLIGLAGGGMMDYCL